MASSCGSVLIALYVSGSAVTYGSSGFCNSTNASMYGLLNTWGTSGAPSGCATGTPSIPGVVSGTCKGYTKPSWQSVFGNPTDGLRDLPDISLFGAVPVVQNALWGHAYVICDSGSGGGCPSGDPTAWTFEGGTSASTPVVAGIQALLMQTSAVSWGKMNPFYYALASAEYGASGSSSCNSSNGITVVSNCIFYDVTAGDMDVPCTTGTTTNNCYLPSGTYGVLSTSTSS